MPRCPDDAGGGHRDAAVLGGGASRRSGPTCTTTCSTRPSRSGRLRTATSRTGSWPGTSSGSRGRVYGIRPGTGSGSGVESRAAPPPRQGRPVTVLGSQLCSAESLRSPALRACLPTACGRCGTAKARTAGPCATSCSTARCGSGSSWPRRLARAGAAAPGPRGLGFGVGKEAAHGAVRGLLRLRRGRHRPAAEAAVASSGWTARVGWSGGLDNLNKDGLCPPDDFAGRVRFRPVDMNAIPRRLRTGPSTSPGHRAPGASGYPGGRRGLRGGATGWPAPGGIGVHTTEYPVSSNDVTVRTVGPSSTGGATSRRWSARCDGPGFTSSSRLPEAPRPRTCTSTRRRTPTRTCAPSSAGTSPRPSPWSSSKGAGDGTAGLAQSWRRGDAMAD